MATALHPQTMLATKYAGEPIGDPFDFPLAYELQPSSASRTANG
jgi:DMSO/TMAO reductase YedYZ molybdopterin-dependent catalytic subunit